MADQGQSRDIIRASEVSLALLGPVRLGDLGGRDLTPRSRKTRALLVIIALSRTPVSRARLSDLLWGDRGEEQARASLRQALYELRGLAEAGALTADRQSVCLGPKVLATDVAELEHLVASKDCDGLAEALGSVLWPLAADLDDVTPEFDDWLRDERARLATTLVQGSVAVAETTCEGSDGRAARCIADAVERIDPLSEDAVQTGLRADLAQGDRAAAMRRYQRFAERMLKELGIEPAPATRQLLDRACAPALPPPPPSPGPLISPAARATETRWPRSVILSALLLIALVIAAAIFLLRPAAAASPTVAVLPFENLARQDRSHLASGVSDEILNLLSRQSRIRVLGRFSAAELAGRDKSLESARRLGITHLVDGSVRSSGERVLVIVRLTRVADGAQLWSERYERRLGDIFAVQGDIAGSVATQLARSFGASPLQNTRPDVYDRYLAARQLVRDRREVTLDEADRLLREAIRLDPDYAPALAELAQVTMLRADHPTSYGSVPLGRARAEAALFARRAIRLDPNLGEAWAAMGFLHFSERRSEPFYRKAVQLSPQRPEFHRWRAQSLIALNRFDEAVDEYRRAVAIDPLWSLNSEHLASALFLVGREDEGRRAIARFLSLSTDERAKLQLRGALAEIDWQIGRHVRIFEQLATSYPHERQIRFELSSSLATLGERSRARAGSGADPIAAAVLTADWPRLAETVRGMGRDYWDYGAYLWHTGELLLASGHGDVIVQHYLTARPRLADGTLAMEAVARPETILALRQAGLMTDADRLQRFLRKHALGLPETGKIADERSFLLLMLAALDGDRPAVLDRLDRMSRSRPMALSSTPAMALRHEPLLGRFAGDPRFVAAEERIRTALNRERQVAGLQPISRAAYISDPKTLLTKN